jgi:hypothetical protein
MTSGKIAFVRRRRHRRQPGRPRHRLSPCSAWPAFRDPGCWHGDWPGVAVPMGLAHAVHPRSVQPSGDGLPFAEGHLPIEGRRRLVPPESLIAVAIRSMRESPTRISPTSTQTRKPLPSSSIARARTGSPSGSLPCRLRAKWRQQGRNAPASRIAVTDDAARLSRTLCVRWLG